MAGILTSASTAGASPPAQPMKPIPSIPSVGTQQQQPIASDLLSASPQQAALNGNAAPIHTNEAINAALLNAFRPAVPDQVNSLLGPAIGHIQGGVLPISYYQPRQAPQISTVKRSS